MVVIRTCNHFVEKLKNNLLPSTDGTGKTYVGTMYHLRLPLLNQHLQSVNLELR